MENNVRKIKMGTNKIPDRILKYMIKLEKYILENGIKDLMCETKDCNFWNSCDGTDEGKYCFLSEFPENDECEKFMTEKEWDDTPLKIKHPEIDLSKIGRIKKPLHPCQPYTEYIGDGCWRRRHEK